MDEKNREKLKFWLEAGLALLLVLTLGLAGVRKGSPLVLKQKKRMDREQKTKKEREKSRKRRRRQPKR